MGAVPLSKRSHGPLHDVRTREEDDHLPTGRQNFGEHSVWLCHNNGLFFSLWNYKKQMYVIQAIWFMVFFVVVIQNTEWTKTCFLLIHYRIPSFGRLNLSIFSPMEITFHVMLRKFLKNFVNIQLYFLLILSWVSLLSFLIYSEFNFA